MWRNLRLLQFCSIYLTCFLGDLTTSTKMVASNPKLIRFYLYTPQRWRLEDGYEMSMGNMTTILRSGMNSHTPTKFLIHGFNHNHKCWFPQEIKDMFLSRGYTGNIVTVDWGPLATPVGSEPFRTLAYPFCVQNVGVVGHILTEFTSALIKFDMVDMGSLHLIGFSLGAHIAGIVGHNLHRRFGRKIARITGLDPAGPFFYTGFVGRSLRKSDAKFVDVIHTDMAEYGHLGMLGHADFYVNGGKPPQPGCRSPSCSHHAAASYFLQSIDNRRIRACRCGSYYAYRNGGCNCYHTVTFGAYANSEAKGSYYLDMTPFMPSGRYMC